MLRLANCCPNILSPSHIFSATQILQCRSVSGVLLSKISDSRASVMSVPLGPLPYEYHIITQFYHLKRLFDKECHCHLVVFFLALQGAIFVLVLICIWHQKTNILVVFLQCDIFIPVSFLQRCCHTSGALP